MECSLETPQLPILPFWFNFGVHERWPYDCDGVTHGLIVFFVHKSICIRLYEHGVVLESR